MSRRQAMGRMSAVAATGAAAWAMPEILTAKPAAGATLSGPVGEDATVAPIGTSDATVVPGAPHDAASAPVGTSTPLAFTGLDLQRDAEVGAALVAGGWAMQHWASRVPRPAGAVRPEAAPRTGDAGRA